MVGIDAAGLEGRCLAHYLYPYDHGEYAKAVREGKKEHGTDIHTMNMKALGITSRDDAKTWFYAWLYGAGVGKLGKILKMSPSVAGKKQKQFLRNMPALARLKQDIAKALLTRKWLKAIDGESFP